MTIIIASSSYSSFQISSIYTLTDRHSETTFSVSSLVPWTIMLNIPNVVPKLKNCLKLCRKHQIRVGSKIGNGFEVLQHIQLHSCNLQLLPLKLLVTQLTKAFNSWNFKYSVQCVVVKYLKNPFHKSMGKMSTMASAKNMSERFRLSLWNIMERNTVLSF